MALNEVGRMMMMMPTLCRIRVTEQTSHLVVIWAGADFVLNSMTDT